VVDSPIALTAIARTRRAAFFACAVLIAAVITIYSRVFHCEFVDFDDPRHVVGNPCVVAGLGWRSMVWAFSHYHACQWIPLTWISYMVDSSLFGLDPGWMHLGNLALHALNSCLVFFVLRRLTGDFWPSFAVAALFAVHPINVESVAWIAERKNVLSTAFWLLAMWAYTHHAAKPRGRWMWAVAAFMALGLLAKPMLVTLPCALLLLDIWPLRRASDTSWARLIGEKAVLFLLSAASCATTLGAAAHEGALATPVDLTFQERLVNALTGYTAYLQNLFWPSDLAVLYPIKATHPTLEILVSIVLLAGITVCFVLLRKRMPWLLIGWLWFLGILVPVSSVFQVGAQAYADRFSYIPQLGIFCAMVWTARALPRAIIRWLPAAATAAIAVLALLTVRQVGYWTDTVTLFEHDLAVTPSNGIAHAICGMGWVRRGDYPRAIAHYRVAKRFLPRMGEIRSLLGEALTHTGETAEALDQLRAAVALDPANEHARRNLVTLLVNQGRVAEASRLIAH
jgi:tetratricopeptide (TPR) repeat protein